MFSLFVSKLLILLFWIGSWSELNSGWSYLSKHFAGPLVILSQLTQLVLMCSYVFHYVRAAINDSPMILPTVMSDRRD